MAINYKELENAMIKAAENGLTAADNTEDGGTCNLDFVALMNIGKSARKIVEIAVKCGLSAYPSFWYKHRIVAINSPLVGQANKREAATHAIYNALKDVPGITVHYISVTD